MAAGLPTTFPLVPRCSQQQRCAVLPANTRNKMDALLSRVRWVDDHRNTFVTSNPRHILSEVRVESPLLRVASKLTASNRVLSSARFRRLVEQPYMSRQETDESSFLPFTSAELSGVPHPSFSCLPFGCPTSACHLFSVAVLLSVAVLETTQLVQALLHSSLFLALEFLNFLVELLTILTMFCNIGELHVSLLGTDCGANTRTNLRCNISLKQTLVHSEELRTIAKGTHANAPSCIAPVLVCARLCGRFEPPTTPPSAPRKPWNCISMARGPYEEHYERPVMAFANLPQQKTMVSMSRKAAHAREPKPSSTQQATELLCMTARRYRTAQHSTAPVRTHLHMFAKFSVAPSLPGVSSCRARPSSFETRHRLQCRGRHPTNTLRHRQQGFL